MGNVTHWKRDVQGRPYEKLYPDGRKTSFTYQSNSGNLETVTYANDQAGGQPTMTYRYFIDGSMAGVDHTDAATPDVSYQYDDPLARITAHLDQLGTTQYSYVPFSGSQNGAGALYEINGPWANDTVRHAYDWQGRMQSREILEDGTGTPTHSVAVQFDALDRLTSETNNLGTFTYQYDTGNLTAKPDALQYPAATGIITAFDYYPVTGTANDARLKEIHTTANGGATLSKFNYGYDSAGQIKQWNQQQGTAIRNHAFAYDKASRLTDAIVTDQNANVLKTWSWQYDPTGNRVRESVDAGSTYSQFNNVNQLGQLGGSGTALIEGTVNEPSTVEVNNQPADVTSLPGGDFLFRREIPVNEGNNTVTIEATDASNNTATQSYNIVVDGIEKTLEYDLNGNLRFEKDDQDNVLREFQWDAKNRLIKIIAGTHTSEFEYDGLDRRIRIVEKDNGTETSHETYLWVGTQIVQKRDSTETTVQRNYFSDGFTEGANSYFYTKDHLGSIREVIASDGTTVESRYDYTPWGKVTKTAGTGVESDFLYTGHLYHEPSDLHLTLYRAYDPNTGRWLSRDPLGEFSGDGINLYGYVMSDPINMLDPDGRASLRHHWQALKSWTWDEAKSDLQLGAMATADGFVPGIDPFADSGKYDPCADGAQFSQAMGGVSREAALLATGGKIYKEIGKGVLKSSGISGASGLQQSIVGRAGINAMFGRQAFVEAFGGQAAGNAAFAAFQVGKGALGAGYGIGLFERISEIDEALSSSNRNCE